MAFAPCSKGCSGVVAEHASASQVGARLGGVVRLCMSVCAVFVAACLYRTLQQHACARVCHAGCLLQHQCTTC